jgi:hypothetical protein
MSVFDLRRKKKDYCFSRLVFCSQIKLNLRYWLVAGISSEISCISHLIFGFYAQSKEFRFYSCWDFIALYIYATSSYRKHKLYKYMLPWINLWLSTYWNIYNVWCVLLETEEVCEPCQRRNITVTATKYCDECEEKYCKSCTSSHMVQKRTKTHRLVDITKEIIDYPIRSKKCN